MLDLALFIFGTLAIIACIMVASGCAERFYRLHNEHSPSAGAELGHVVMLSLLAIVLAMLTVPLLTNLLG